MKYYLVSFTTYFQAPVVMCCGSVVVKTARSFNPVKFLAAVVEEENEKVAIASVFEISEDDAKQADQIPGRLSWITI